MSAENLIQITTNNYDASKKHESKPLSFKHNFMPKESNNLQTTMQQLDEVTINMVKLISSYNYYLFEIISCSLLMLLQISNILCLISLYKHNEILICMLLSFTTIGVLINIGFAIFTDTDSIKYLNPQSKILRIIICVSTIIFSTTFSPILWVWIRRKNYPSQVGPRMNNLIMIAFAVALPQSIIAMMITVMHYDVYAVLLLTFSVFSVLIAACSLVIGNSIIVSIYHQTIIIGLMCIIIDYANMLCIVIYIVSDTTSLSLKYYLYNTMFGCPLFALIISYGCAKEWTDTFNVPYASALFTKVLVPLVCILFGIMFTICSDICCTFSAYAMYIIIRKQQQQSGVDWNLLKWIVNNIIITDDKYTVLNYCNCKDKIQRLCLVNGLIIDSLQKTENQKRWLLKQYLTDNSSNNFQHVSLKRLKQYFDDKSWWNWILILLSIDMNTGSNYQIILKTFAFVLYLGCRINRFIILPIFVTIYLNNLNQHTTMTYIAICVQFVAAIIGWVMLLFIFTEICYSMYLIPNIKDDSYKTIRKEIGFYYKATTIYEIRCILETYFESDITNIIVSFVICIKILN